MKFGKRILLFLILLLLFLVSCDYESNNCGNNQISHILVKENIKTIIPVEEKFEIQTYFCEKDCCTCELIKRVNNSEETYCVFFDLDNQELIDVLRAKETFVVVDERNIIEDNKPFFVNYLYHSGYIHNKFCVFNRSSIWTGSFNPTYNGENNDNNAILIHSKLLAEIYLKEFLEIWNEVYGLKGGKSMNLIMQNSTLLEVYFCPEECRAENENSGYNRIMDLIFLANSTIDIAIFSFTDDLIGDALINVSQEGVKVRIITDSLMENILGSEIHKLRDRGIDAFADNRKEMMHHKFIVIDGKIVITGSPNFSSNGFHKNDENFMIIHDKEVSQNYIKEAERLYEKN